LSTYEKDFKTGGAPGWLIFQTLLPLPLLSQKLQYLEAEIGYFVTDKKKNDRFINMRYTLETQFNFQVHLLFKLSSFFLSLLPCRSPLISDHFLNKGADFVSLFWQIHCQFPSFFISTYITSWTKLRILPRCKMSAVKSSCDYCFLQSFSKRNFGPSLLFASLLNNPYKYFDQILICASLLNTTEINIFCGCM